MPSLFSRLKGNKDGPTKVKSKRSNKFDQYNEQLPSKPRWEDPLIRTTIEPEEVVELVKRCTEELKARALDLPFLLLPFRPTSDPSAVRTFIRHFFDGNQTLRGEPLAQELRMAEPMVVSGVLKWCWSRLQGGVVGWDSYELFKVGEQDSNMARDSFKTFVPLSVDNGARAAIIFDFFDLLSATAAHGKMNGFGGRKLSRMAGWWAFEHKDTGNGFEAGYKSWLSAADATSHLFFAYLRSLAPTSNVGGISLLPMSLQKLLQDTEYPPQRPALMQSSTNKVVMIVDTVSPTPFALLRRARNFVYRDEDRALREWSEYEDPTKALTEECRRVLRAVSAANQSQAVSSAKHSTGLRDASWSRFEDIGFSSALEEEDEDDDSGRPTAAGRRNYALRSTAASGTNLGRPTTPSWADFLSEGFANDGKGNSHSMLLPPDKVLPPIETAVRQRSSQSHRPRLETDRHLEPGELASITRFDLDDSFWWVWMSSLAPEETPDRKSAFGRCAVVETVIRTGRWLVMEEMVQGAAPEPDAGAYIAEKKGFFGWTRRNKSNISRRKSTGKHALDKGDMKMMGFSKTSIGPDQHAKIQAAAQQLQAKQTLDRKNSEKQPTERRGRTDAELLAEKTNSVFTLQPVIMSEASPAMKWANKYDKDAIREAYLANTNAGKGISSPALQTNGHGQGSTSDLHRDERPPEVPAKSPSLRPQPSPGFMPESSTAMLHQDEEPEQQQPYTEKALEEPHDVHPVERASEATGRSTPAPMENHSMDVPRDTMVSPAPDMSPESRRRARKLHKEKERAEKAGGFRKLFGRNKNRQSRLPPNAASEVNSMGVGQEQAIESEPVAPADTIVSPQRPQAHHEETTYATPREEASDPLPDHAPEPAMQTEQVYEPSIQEEEHPVSHANATEAKETNHEASQFSQGPLADQPAFAPEDSEGEDEAVPPPIARHPSRSPERAPRQPPQPKARSQPQPKPRAEQPSPPKPRAEPQVQPQPKAAAHPELQAQAQQPEPKKEEEAPVAPQDRWAQIRKNAAERAAQRQSEEKNGNGPTKPEGEEDTSGEETIESRVARIKARVAELTSNMDGPGATPGPANSNRNPPSVSRR